MQVVIAKSVADVDDEVEESTPFANLLAHQIRTLPAHAVSSHFPKSADADADAAADDDEWAQAIDQPPAKKARRGSAVGSDIADHAAATASVGSPHIALQTGGKGKSRTPDATKGGQRRASSGQKASSKPSPLQLAQDGASEEILQATMISGMV